MADNVSLKPGAFGFASSFCSKHPNHPACQQWLKRLSGLQGLVGQRAAQGVQYKQGEEWLKRL
jgi:hypothetical protein